ncbi:PREDICTED: polycystic kidney disease protein 1-like 2 [Branchiostoma belcheri]|uniref:Polycystic kidney disease protein 1-like 2 n=1 Tax=Branchiostoma belcheri TaxID=7741 RepID=A0A6P4YRW0_BRABE|nr:PREDICTED: polycystic kidney disease protein 1-like 2 [Branchiostoma belcheri]
MDDGLTPSKITIPENVETAGSELTLPKNVLPYGKVAIRLEVTVEETLSGLRVVTSAEQWVNVLSSALVADIAGGSAKSLARGSDIVLDGSFSTDPDAMVTDAADFTYNWTCVTESGTSCEDVFGDGGTSQSYVISSNNLQPSVRGLTVQLSVSFQDRIPGTTSQTLEVFPVGSPSISIRCFSNCNRKINPSEKLILVAECTNCEENELVSYNWTLQEAPDGFGRSDLNWDTESTTGRNLPDVVFEPEVFTALGDYTFRVEASLDYGRQGFSEYSFEPNEPPVVGSCTVSPENGTAMVTEFTFTCTGFSDSDEPLTYTFLFNTDAAAGFTPLYTETEPTTPPQLLPVGQESRDFVVRIQAQVSDSLGATSNVETSVQVLALPAEQSTAVASQLVVGENSPLTQLVREGDAKSLVQMSNSVTSVLNTVPTNASAETRRAATEAREALVSALTTIKPTSVSSVNLVASALGSATSGGDDVSADSQVAAANSLKNMAGFLQSLPPEDLEIGQIEKSSSFMFTAVVNIMAGSSKVSDKTKISNETDNDQVEKAKKTTQGIFAAIDTMNELMLARKRPNEKPTVIQQGPFEMALQRQNCRDMRSQIVRPSENSDTWFRIPDASTLFGQSCGRGQSVGFENYHTSLNPYSYAGNSDKIKSPLASLKFRSDSGPVGVNDLQVPIDVMMPQKPGTVVVQTERGETTPTGQDVMSMHSFNVTEADSSVHVTVTPHVEGIPIRLFLGINSAPSRQVYNWTTSLPLAVDSMYSIPLGNNSYLRPDPFQWFLSASDLGLTGSEQLFLGVDHEPFTNDTSTNDTTVMWGDLSEALKLGYGGVNFTLNYTLQIFTSKCLFFDDAQQQWSSDGCEVGPLTSTTLTHCLCDHLTTFGSDFQFFVAPNSLNILSALQGFANIGENPSVVITIGVLFGLYLLIVIWARWEDKKDLSKVGATVLRGAGRNSHSYQVQVFTGTRANAGTSSQVFLVLRGELGQSVPYVLEDKTRITFKQGAVDTFVVTSSVHLGPLQSIHIWHNNIGPYPSWFLEQVIVTDLQEEAKHVFLLKSWLAVEEGDGKVDREVKKATDKDLTRFARLFSTKTSKDFRDGHLWFSVIGRPATSPFTRVQRISCCLSLLMCTMLTNIMFFGKGESMPKPPPVYILGFQVQFPISWGQIMIGIQSALMVIPVNLLIVQIFRNCAARPSRKIRDMRNVPRKDPEGRASSRMSFSKDDTVLDRKSSSYEVPSGGEGTSAAKVSEKVVQQAKEQDLPHQTAVLVEEIDDVEDESYDATVMQSGQSEKIAEMAKKKKKRLLPWWCVFFAWFLVFSTCSLSAFFTMLYGFEYGREKAEAWVLTFLTSFFFDLAISQPLKILLIGFIFALIIKKPDSLDDDVPPAQLYEDEEFFGPQTEDQPKETTPEATGPPDQGVLEVAREQRFVELGFRDACYDFVFYTSYILLLIIIANGNRDQYMYQMSNHLRDTFIGPFSKVNDFEMFWKFVRVNMTSDLHDVKWYNEKSLNRPGFLEDTSSFLVGHPRLRQVRVSADKSCDVPGVMAKVMSDCDRSYSLLDSDDNSYDVGWTHNNMTFDVRNWENVSYGQRPWIYQPASLSAAVPDSGEHGTYFGGGYLVELSNSADMELIDELQEKNWIDDNTRAVFIEFIVYNANANLFAVFNLLAEFTNLGRVFPQSEIMVVRLYPYTTAWGFVLLGCHGLFLLVSLYLAYKEVRRILTLGKEYFKMFWRVVELVLSLLAMAEIGVHLYTAYLILGFNTSKKENISGDERYNKYKQAASWEKINTYILGWLVCVACLKMLYLCRFNKTIQRGPKVARKSLAKLLSFLIIFVTFFMAFSLFAYLVLGTKLTKYGSFVRTMQTLFGVMLGDMDYPTLKSAHDVLGPLMLFGFVTLFANILVMMFLVILSDAYSDVVEEEQIQGKSENDKIKEYGVYRLRKLLMKKPNSVAITKQKSEAEISVISDMPPSIPTRNIDGKSLKNSLSEDKATSENDLKQGAHGHLWLDDDWQKVRSMYAGKFDEAAVAVDITWPEGACENSKVGTARRRSSTFQSRRTLSEIEEHTPAPLKQEGYGSTSTGPVDMASSVDVASGSQQSEVPPARSNSLLALLHRIRPSSFDKHSQNDALEKDSGKDSNPAGSVDMASSVDEHQSTAKDSDPAAPVVMAWSGDVAGENPVGTDRRRIERQSTVVSFSSVVLPLPGSDSPV